MMVNTADSPLMDIFNEFNNVSSSRDKSEQASDDGTSKTAKLGEVE